MQKILTEFVLVSFLVSVAAVPSISQNSEPLPARDETIRIARLVDLAKVWGAVKYFHPYLAYRDIDWDQALIETIPKVNASRTPAEYAAAVGSMLERLGDKNTRATIPSTAPPARATSSDPVKTDPIRLEEGLMTIDVSAVAEAISRNNGLERELTGKVSQLLPQAKAVLVDIRAREGFDYAYQYEIDRYLRALMPMVLDRPVTLATSRYRMHNGYPPQVGSSSGGYYSGMVTESPQTFPGNNKTKSPRMIILVNELSGVPQILSGMQAAKAAFVVKEGQRAEEPAVESQTFKLVGDVEVKMRTSELINPDGTLGFEPDTIAAHGKGMEVARRLLVEDNPTSTRNEITAAASFPASQKEKTYPEIEFPAAEYRLPALFRFWNVINLFFPYKHLIDKPWNDVLPKYIRRFEINTDAADYQLTVHEMVAEIQDSHGSVRMASQPAKSAERLGRYYPPISIRFVEGQALIVSVLPGDTAKVQPGEVIATIDGEPTEKYIQRFARYIPSSTPQALRRSLQFSLLRGPKDSKVRLTLRGIEGKTREAELLRTVLNTDPRWAAADQPEKKLPVFGVLPSGFGYVDLGRLPLGDVDKMFETIKRTPATIFDMRGYPRGTAWDIAPRLTDKKTPAAASFRRPIWTANAIGGLDFSSGTDYSFMQTLPEPKGDKYKGKVAMLIDENAQSQSEHTAMFFESATDVTFIGTPTSGANGDVTNHTLPGNITVGFSGHDVRHADGRQLQRLGIQPHIKVAPTIKGTLAGRDEVLEAAVKFLSRKGKK